MANAEKVELKQVLQVCVVVKDIQKAMESYWNTFGIGPWHIYMAQPPTLADTTFRGEPEPFTAKLAVAQIGSVQWELIEPLEGRSTYKELLEQKGEGLHHIAVATDDFDKTISSLAQQGIGVLMSGTIWGTPFAYMDTEKAVGAIFEIYNMAPGFELPPPEATYPPST